MDDILSEIFDKIREREEAAEREDPAALAETSEVVPLAGLPGVELF
jgi:hypothetical protein